MLFRSKRIPVFFLARKESKVGKSDEKHAAACWGVEVNIASKLSGSAAAALESDALAVKFAFQLGCVKFQAATLGFGA